MWGVMHQSRRSSSLLLLSFIIILSQEKKYSKNNSYFTGSVFRVERVILIVLLFFSILFLEY